jgi:inositol transport system substrate-binding protein
MSMKARRVLSLLAILLFTVLLIAGCSSNDSKQATESKTSTGKKTIGVLNLDFSDQFQTYLLDGMKGAAEKVKADNIDVVYMDAKYDSSKQMSQMENLIAQKVDVIIVSPVDTAAAKPMIDLAVKAKIPVISVNRPLANQELAVSYVGSDSVYSGELEAQQMADALKGKGNIVVLEGNYGHQAQIDRKQGYDNILKKYPEMKIVATQTGEWYRDKGMKVMENWLQSGITIDAVLAENDEMALGALKAIIDAGKFGKIKVGGIDGTPEALKYLKDGKLDFTVFQDGKGQGKTAIEVAVKVIKGESVDKQYMIPYELVTPDKADTYLAKFK